MQLKKIQERFSNFKTWLESRDSENTLFIWDAQNHFRQHWNADVSDFAGMYDTSIDSHVSRRLWSRENYAPKAMMLEFARQEPEMVRLAFSTLFDESKDVEVRLDRFLFYCNELLKDYKSKNYKPLFNRHFHDDDFAMISLYLAFRYPDRYAIYPHRAFVNLLRSLGSPDLPQAPDPARYFKVVRTLYQMMQKDEELMDLHQRRFSEGNGTGLLLVYEFCLMDTEGVL
jgi:hypothetical protein